MDAEKTGAYLAVLRKARGLTQQEIADQLGVSNKTVSKWESGGGFPDIAVLPALAELYGVTADDILAGETRARTADAPLAAGAWSAYHAQRADLRFRIGAGVSAVFTAACYLYRFDANVCILLLLCGLLTLWIGWRLAVQGGEKPLGLYRSWFHLLLPLLTAFLWLTIWAVWTNRNFAYYWLKQSFPDVGQLGAVWNYADFTKVSFLLLAPVAYFCLQVVFRRKTGETAPLLARPYVVILLLFCGILLVGHLWYTNGQLVSLAEEAQHFPSHVQGYSSDAQEKLLLQRIELSERFRWYQRGLIAAAGLSWLIVWGRRRKAALAKKAES